MNTQQLTELLYEVATATWNRYSHSNPAYRMLDRDDAIQEAVARGWELRAQFDPSLSQAQTFFSMVARHAIGQLIMRQQKAVARRTSSYFNETPGGSLLVDALVGETEEVVEAANERDLQARLAAALANLPSDLQAAALTNPASMARLRGISRQAASQARRRLIGRLRDMMGVKEVV